MAGLPRKYAKMGFSKGWRAYKAAKSGGNTIKKGGAFMARRRRYRTARKSYSRSSGMGGIGKLALGGAAYGIVREPINQLTKNLPMVGSLGDEVLMLIVSALAASKGSGYVRTIGRAGVVIEAHNLARGMGSGLFSGLLGTSATTSTSAASSTTLSFR